jgi:adenylate cyclase
MSASDRTTDGGRVPTESDRPSSSRHQMGRISLAHEAPLQLGALCIEPALRRVAQDDGREEIVEPRVMQVLVALIRAKGGILSRDDLLMSCWHGVVVGEDAINRVMGRLRRLADGIGDGAFKLETITKVGYRLVPTEPRAGAGVGPSASSPDARRTAPAAAGVEPLLAVLAFDNLSGDAGMAWFSDGVSEEILQTVARSAELKVIGRGSSFQFRGAEKAAARVAATLKATHVLDGSVRRGGTTVRIVAHLIECAGETTLWSGRFDRELSDILALQDDIAAAVAAALKVVFAPATPADTIDPAAYDVYLAARGTIANQFFVDAETGDAHIKLLEQATALAPNFARGWAELAYSRAKRMQFQDYEEPFPTARAKVVEAATTALGLNPGLGQVYQVLAMLEPFGALADREALHSTALAVSPHDPWVLFEASIFSADVGRIRDALGYVGQAHGLDPMFLRAASWHASMLDAQGRYGESRPLWERFRALWPDSETIAWNAIAAAAHNADWSRFDQLVDDTRGRGLNGPGMRSVVWFGRNLRGRNAESIRVALEHNRNQIARSGDAPIEWLTSLYQLGLKDEVFEMIDQASFAYVFDREKKWAGGPSVATLFSRMHNAEMMRDPRFPRLCTKLGLCAYWAKTERWPDCVDEVAYDFKAEARLAAAQQVNGARG